MQTATQKPKSGSLFDRSPKSSPEEKARQPEPAAIGQSSAVLTPTDPASLTPCPTCHSAIRWLDASNTPRCIACQPPKFAALVRRKEVLVISVDQGHIGDGEPFPVNVRRWEILHEMPDGRLLSESGIRELISRGELDPLTAARVGVGGHRGGGAGGGGVAADENFPLSFDRWREIDPDEFFKAKAAAEEKSKVKSKT